MPDVFCVRIRGFQSHRGTAVGDESAGCGCTAIVLRCGFAPLYTRFEDVWRAVDVLGEILDTRAWRKPRYQTRARVT